MRIGTWNLEGTCSALQRHLLEQRRCDVWLLTEVPTAIAIRGMGMGDHGVGRRLEAPTLTHAARLSVPTQTLAHTCKGHRSIDHIAALLMTRDIEQASRIPTTVSRRRLSDDDAYVIDLIDSS